MYIKVRNMQDCNKSATFNLSKLTSIEDTRDLISKKLNVEPNRQKLFFRGKQMEDGYTIFDYGVNINDVIQLMVVPVFQEVTNTITPKTPAKLEEDRKTQRSTKVEKSNKNSTSCSTQKNIESTEYFRIGDLVDVQYAFDGSWWEAKITKITRNPRVTENYKNDTFLYSIKYERHDDKTEDDLKLERIRPRARTMIPLSKLKSGSNVLVNYNIENPAERGHWFDCQIQHVVNKRHKKLIGTILLSQSSKLEDCHIKFTDEVFKVEPVATLESRDKSGRRGNTNIPLRKSAASCRHCQDDPNKICKECGCSECGGKENPNQQVMCDECDQPIHIYCLDPPLESIPEEDEWFCPMCKNDDTEIVRAGEKLKQSKKRASLPSTKNNSQRDWGKGFACVGRQKVCTIVKQNHFGAVPGIEVGTLWKFRVQVSEAGVHRPPVAGIHGRDCEGAYSLVLAGGYEDDEDHGEEFTYTGSGGRDLSGNKRTAEQSCDQILTRMNKALALNCNVPLNENGAESKNWKDGKPVRVIRNYKGRKHSKYAPEDGNRYDGIYKIVKYWQSTGKSGYKVWRYLLRRDDKSPAPWTKKGIKRIEELGLTMQFPEGYEEAMKEKENLEEEEPPKNDKKGVKRKSRSSKEDSQEDSPKSKRVRPALYVLEEDLQNLINQDSQNAKLWKECQEFASEGKVAFLKAVEEKFVCVCCQSLAVKPVHTLCHHNFCKLCLNRSFKAGVFCCPSCRTKIGEDLEINSALEKVLTTLFPGYNSK